MHLNTFTQLVNPFEVIEEVRALAHDARVNNKFRKTELEAAQEYFAALKAHNCYFKHADLAAFIVDYVVSGTVPER